PYPESRRSPHLHALPTRRSSDLRRYRTCRCRSIWFAGFGERLRSTTRTRRRSASSRQIAEQTRDRGTPLQALVGPVRLALERASDRKSTRLNSSHQIISYAVFCL